MPVISPLAHIPSHHTSMVPCIEVYAAQGSTQYRSSDFHISTDSPPGVGLSIRSPALVLYSVPPTQEGSWPSWPNCSEYRYLRQRLQAVFASPLTPLPTRKVASLDTLLATRVHEGYLDLRHLPHSHKLHLRGEL